MTKLSKRPLGPDKLNYFINNLWNAFTLMESKQEVRELIKDLFTHTEYKMIAKRLEIARRLIDGDNYDDIKTAVKVTEKPIANMSNTLANNGTGLKNAYRKLKNLEQKYQQKRSMHQDYIERRVRPKIGRTILGDMIKFGAVETKKAIYRGIKKSSTKNQLAT